ncbi:MAG: FliM/FliN family flagellar motor switch protein, partial [Myxococcota bacterium]
MARRLRRNPLTALPRLSREQVRVQNALMAHLPSTAFEAGFKERLRSTFQPLLRADLDLWFDSITPCDTAELSRRVHHPTCLAVVGLAPTEHSMLVELDLTVAQSAVDRLLGGAAEDIDGQRPLSEIEEGVCSFLFLRVLSLLQDGEGSEHQLSLKLNGIVSNLQELDRRLPPDLPYLCVTFKVFLDVTTGFLRVFLPLPFVQQTLVRPHPDDGPALRRRLRRLQELAPRVAGIKVPLRVEVGRIPVSLQDLKALDTGDIILIEDPQVRLTDGALTGSVDSFVGGGHYGTVRGSLSVGELGVYEVLIEQIVPSAPPPAGGRLSSPGAALDEEYAREMPQGTERGAEYARQSRAFFERRALGEARPLTTGVESRLAEEFSMSDDEGYGGDAYEEEPLPESVGMLRDVAVPLVVELGRVSVSAADVMALRPGQVIELNRSPNEAVDLVVDGKRRGRG